MENNDTPPSAPLSEPVRSANRMTSSSSSLRSSAASVSHRKFLIALRILLAMIVTLMALGAGVRTMNAGLSCPDWPLCFGQVIPAFHVGVWFEFVHRAYAGLVAIAFVACLVYVLRAKQMPLAAKRASVTALIFLLLQIVAGGLTVLLLVKAIIVTSHLMLATFFLLSVFWIHETVRLANREQARRAGAAGSLPRAEVPFAVSFFSRLFPLFILGQIFLGGLVASTYAGSVCVDWPLCNGQWVPTWAGAIGLQIMHRFFAYFLAFIVPLFALWTQGRRSAPWMTSELVRLTRWSVFIVLTQVCIGVANLVMFIPPSVTVVHQSVALIFLLVNIRQYFVVRELAQVTSEYPVALRAQPV